MNQTTLMKVCNAQASAGQAVERRPQGLSEHLPQEVQLKLLMLSRAALFCAALAVAPCIALSGASTSALADSGGYRRPGDIGVDRVPDGAPRAAPRRRAAATGARRRPAVATSPGRPATSRSRGPTAAQALQQYRASQQPRRPAGRQWPPRRARMRSGATVAMRRAVRRATERRRASPAATARRRSGPCSGRCRHPTARRISGNPRPIRPTSNGASRPCATRTRRRGWRPLATGRRQHRAMRARRAPPPRVARAWCGWCCSSRRRCSCCCGWRAAAPPASPPPAPRRRCPGSAATRFRVGQTIPLDPAPFLLAAGVTKVQPPPASGMISVEAVGLLDDAGVRLHRLYLPGRHRVLPTASRRRRRAGRVPLLLPARRGPSGQPGRVGRVARSGAGDDRLAGVPDQGRQDLRPRLGARADAGSRRVSRPRRCRRSAG